MLEMSLTASAEAMATATLGVSPDHLPPALFPTLISTFCSVIGLDLRFCMCYCPTATMREDARRNKTRQSVWVAFSAGE